MSDVLLFPPIRYFRTIARRGRVEAVPLRMTEAEALKATDPAAFQMRLPDGRVLDLAYGWAPTAEEVLSRDVRWLNARLR